MTSPAPLDQFEAIHRLIRPTTDEERAEGYPEWRFDHSHEWYEDQYGPGTRARDNGLITHGYRLLLAADERIDYPKELPTAEELKLAILMAIHPERYTGEPGIPGAEMDPIFDEALSQLPAPPPKDHALFGAWKGLASEAVRKLYRASRDETREFDDAGLSTEDLIATEYDQPEYLIDELVASRGFHATIGAAKAGKTMLSIYKAIGVAAGIPVLGKATTQGKVLFIEEEGSPYFMRQRIRRILDALEAREGRPIRPDVRWFLRQQFNLATPTGVDRLRRIIERERPIYLVMGPLAMLGHLTNENDAAEMQDRVRTLLALSTEYDLTVDIAHHRNKTGQSRQPTGVGAFFETTRGSSALIGGTDSANGLLRDPDEEFGKLFQLNRDGPAFVMNYRFDPETLLHVPVEQDAVPTRAKASIHDVRDYVRSEPGGVLVADTAARFGVSPGTARTRLEELVVKGWATVWEGPRRIRKYLPTNTKRDAPDATLELDDAA